MTSELMMEGSNTVSSIVSLIIWVLTIIAEWKIFTKAGEKGWKAIIPIYSGYILFKIVWKTKWFWLGLVGAVVFSILYSAALGLMIASSTVAGVILMIISIILLIALIVLGIKLYVNLSKAYGHGAGFAVGLIFLNVIFILILGFGSSQYVGNPDNK
ncbi:MAG: hypothetical protein J1F01_06245 [Oscillospiraceae bacterium]|nr:hypothetical protein [Oscillospiraceae bacterium]